MKKMSGKAISSIIMLVILFCSITGVYSTWKYLVYSAPTPANSSLGFVMEWKVYNALPENAEGNSHKTIINNIVNGNNGLNNPNSFINTQINNRNNYGYDYFGSMDNQKGGEAKQDFDTSNSGINFIIQSPQNNTNIKYLFSTKENLGQTGGFLYASSPNVPPGEFIYIIYRTTLKLDSATNKWESIATEIGYAPAKDYANTTWNPFAKKQPAFDFTKWQAGKLGLNKNNAIYSFAGQNTTAVLDNPSDKVYYKFTPESKGNRTVTITESNANCKVKVYDSNMSPVSTNAGAQNSKKVGWNGKANTTYYIEVTGHTTVAFSIA